MQHTGLMQTPFRLYIKMHRYTSYLYIFLHAICLVVTGRASNGPARTSTDQNRKPGQRSDRPLPDPEALYERVVLISCDEHLRTAVSG